MGGAEHVSLALTPAATAPVGTPPASTFLRLLSRGVLVFAATLAVWSVAPAVVGWQPRLVLTGSMSPTIGAGDVVVTAPVPLGSVTVGQVIAFDDPSRTGRVLVHRVVGRRDDG